ncbi:MAG TPA: hypothetical protein VI365_17120 [Trebonia sp.]
MSQGAEAQLTARFGNITCFRFSEGRSWVIVGNGVSTTAATMQRSPGGAIVAVETCAAVSKACLNADSTHTFSAFTVFRAPDPATMPLNLWAPFGTDVLLFSNASCGVFDFDIATHQWYRGLMADTQRLLSSPRSLAPVAAGRSIPGSRALVTGVPAASTSACFT